MFRFRTSLYPQSMNRKMKKLSDQDLRYLISRFEPIQFTNPFDLVYEDQIPITGVILVEGDAILTKKSKPLEKILPGTVLGIHQLLNNVPVKNGCKILGQARVILLQKSEILELENDPVLRDAILP